MCVCVRGGERERERENEREVVTVEFGWDCDHSMVLHSDPLEFQHPRLALKTVNSD